MEELYEGVNLEKLIDDLLELKMPYMDEEELELIELLLNEEEETILTNLNHPCELSVKLAPLLEDFGKSCQVATFYGLEDGEEIDILKDLLIHDLETYNLIVEIIQKESDIFDYLVYQNIIHPEVLLTLARISASDIQGRCIGYIEDLVKILTFKTTFDKKWNITTLDKEYEDVSKKIDTTYNEFYELYEESLKAEEIYEGYLAEFIGVMINLINHNDIGNMIEELRDVVLKVLNFYSSEKSKLHVLEMKSLNIIRENYMYGMFSDDDSSQVGEFLLLLEEYQAHLKDYKEAKKVKELYKRK